MIKEIIAYPFKKVKKAIEKATTPEEPIKTIISTNYPHTYTYYWDALGFPTDVIGGVVIVWNKGIDKAKREKFVQKINEMV